MSVYFLELEGVEAGLEASVNPLKAKGPCVICVHPVFVPLLSYRVVMSICVQAV